MEVPPRWWCFWGHGLPSNLLVDAPGRWPFLAFAPTAGFALPAGFSDSICVSGLGGSVTAMAFAPDGRLFVLQQTGAVRIVSGGVLLPTPILTLTQSRQPLHHQCKPIRTSSNRAANSCS